MVSLRPLNSRQCPPHYLYQVDFPLPTLSTPLCSSYGIILMILTRSHHWASPERGEWGREPKREPLLLSPRPTWVITCRVSLRKLHFLCASDGTGHSFLPLLNLHEEAVRPRDRNKWQKHVCSNSGHSWVNPYWCRLNQAHLPCSYFCSSCLAILRPLMFSRGPLCGGVDLWSSGWPLIPNDLMAATVALFPAFPVSSCCRGPRAWVGAWNIVFQSCHSAFSFFQWTVLQLRLVKRQPHSLPRTSVPFPLLIWWLSDPLQGCGELDSRMYTVSHSFSQGYRPLMEARWPQGKSRCSRLWLSFFPFPGFSLWNLTVVATFSE